ncbi:hypothetical protein BH10BDE1_BH10BDE1_13250 [soil metagenome]
MENLFSHIRTLLFAVALTFAAVACEPKSSTVDETQSQMSEANANLARMSVLESELLPYGVNCRTPTYSSYAISRRSASELTVLQTKLNEYIAQGSNALRISKRLDVAYGDRAGLADRIGNARMLLNQVTKSLGVGTDSTGRFWTTWQECNSTHQQNLSFYGINILYFNMSKDGSALMRLPRERRREILTRARRYRECDLVLSQGRAQIFEGKNYQSGSSKSYDVTGKAIDPLAPPTSQQKSLKSLIDSLNED